MPRIRSTLLSALAAAFAALPGALVATPAEPVATPVASPTAPAEASQVSHAPTPPTATSTAPTGTTQARDTQAGSMQAGTTQARTSQEILDASRPADWRSLDPANTLYMDLAGGRVVIELAPAFAPEHVGNIRTLAREGFWNGLSIYRAQDNFVVQFGDITEEGTPGKPIGGARAKLPAEFTRTATGLDFHALPDHDGWAAEVGFAADFPAARDPSDKLAWMTHCYGALGAGRDLAADSSNGTELYVVTGQSPRQLDRNITLVGRVIKGMELLASLPRGTGALGFYEDPAQRTPIHAMRLASDVPVTERTPLEVLRTGTATFDAFVESRRNRRDAFYKRPAGHVDVCNIAIPTRVPPAD